MEDLLLSPIRLNVLETIIENSVKRAISHLIPIPNETEADELLTIQEAAEILNLSISTIYCLVSKSQIPVSKRSKRLYFSKHELIAWIKAGRKKTTSEVQAEANAYLQTKTKRS